MRVTTPSARRTSALRLAAAITLVPVSAIAFAGTNGDIASNPNPNSGKDRAVQQTEGLTATTWLTTQRATEARTRFEQVYSGTGILERESGRIERLFGAPIAGGNSPVEAAALAASRVAGMMNVDAENLIPSDRYGGQSIQPLMYDPNTDSYGFTAVAYHHVINGVKVHGSEIVFLVRNESGHPVVLASTDIRDMGNFQVEEILDDGSGPQVPGASRALIEAEANGLAVDYTDTTFVYWNGNGEVREAPRAGVKFTATAGGPADPDTFMKKTYIADARTGEILMTQSEICSIDVSGNVSAIATSGLGADICGPEIPMAMPYARVSIGGTVAFADEFGDFVIPNAGAGAVTVNSQVRGEFFRVFNEAGANASINTSVTPPGPVNIVHNPTNPNELQRAEVNTYINANLVRDFVLRINPAYPVIGGQTEFTINANIDSNCNATYSGNAINFYTSGGGCPNTGFASVVFHEYGHHLVNVAGSGQGAYGEGMGDVMSVLMLDDPGLGYGFFNNCSQPLRNADNSCQFTSNCSSCGDQIHACGQLISGIVWDLRMVLGGTTGLQTTADLAVNSMPLHTGTSINAGIAVDYLTLDDDDANIFNGTPNYDEITVAFGLHNIDTPELDPVSVALVGDTPSFVDPAGSTEIRVEVTSLDSTPNGVVELFYRELGGGTGFTAVTMAAAGGDEYVANFPATDCGSTQEFYIVADAVNGDEARLPNGAPFDNFEALSAIAVADTFNDDFEGTNGWTVQNGPGLTDGAWTQGVPVGGGDRGDPPADFDGSGQAWLTDNADGNTDVDGGFTRLVSPVLDASAGDVLLSYARWYSNTFGGSPEADVFTVDISDDAGATWQQLEEVGPSGPEVDGGWFKVSFNLAEVAGFTPNNQFRVRFTAEDAGTGSVIEAGIDAVSLSTIECEDDTVVGDLDGDGDVDFNDLVAFLAAYGPCPGGGTCAADFDGDGDVAFSDLLLLLAAFDG